MKQKMLTKEDYNDIKARFHLIKTVVMADRNDDYVAFLFDDAEIVSKLLGITLCKVGGEIPFTPYRVTNGDVTDLVKTLLGNGYTVVRVTQSEFGIWNTTEVWYSPGYSTEGRNIMIVHPAMPVNGIPYVAVGIQGSRKAVALCGLTNAEDFQESLDNARRIATEWNRTEAYRTHDPKNNVSSR